MHPTDGEMRAQALRLVLADADETARPLCAVGLRELGWEVVEVAHGAMLDNIVQRVVPDVIVLDASIQQQDSNGVARVIVQGAGHGRIPVLLTCETSTDKMAIRQLVTLGVRAILVKPILHSTLVGKISELVPWAIQPPSFSSGPSPSPVDDGAGDASAGASSRVASNSSLLVAQLLCPFHEQVIPFPAYSLRSDRIETTFNYFDLPVYLRPIGKADYCNYHLVNVTVCPQCLFASNHHEMFWRAGDRQRKSASMREKIIQVVQADQQRRRRISGELTPSFFNEQRSMEDALLSLELALDSSRSLLQADSSQFINELARMGNYHLRLAHLKEHLYRGFGQGGATEQIGLELPPQVVEHYANAQIFFKKAAQFVQGALLSKTLYQLAATSIFMNDDETARHAVDRLEELNRHGLLTSDERGTVTRYHHRAKKAWGQRDQHRLDAA